MDDQLPDVENYLPLDGETVQDFGARLQRDGAREIYLRKAMRAHFDMGIADIIAEAAHFPECRKREINALRERFPDLTENRLAYRIRQSMTLSKDEASQWAKDIVSAEGEAG